MYDLDNGGEGIVSEVCKPDYEKQTARVKKDLDVLNSTKLTLIHFVTYFKHYIHRNQKPSTLAEFIGKLELDILQKTDQFNELLKRIEKEK